MGESRIGTMKKITDRLLISLAGERSFAHGKECFATDAVGELREYKGKITTVVQGSASYQVTLRHTSRQFEGVCDCPASDNFDFCKHCVAVALKYRTELAERERLSRGSTGDKLLAYLKSLNKQQLAGELYALLTQDKTLFDEWSLKAEIASGGLDAKAMKKRITAAISYNRHIYRYPQVRKYFARVETVTQFLLENRHQFDAEQALSLTEYALQRLEKALDTIDDSGGFRDTCLLDLHACHVQACAALEWRKDKLASYLAKLFLQREDSLYPAIPDAYTEVLADEGLARFYAEINQVWEALPPLQTGEEWTEKYRYVRLGNVLEQQARMENNQARIIELKAKMATQTRDFIELSKLCQSQDMSQAERWLARAQEGNKNVKSRLRECDVDYQQINIWRQQGKWADALELQWQLYCQRPSLQHYQWLKELAKDAGSNHDWLQKALAFNAEQHASNQLTWQKHTYANAIVELNLHEQRPEPALRFAEQHGIDPQLLLATAAANAQHVERVLPLYARVARQEVRQGNNEAYRSAIAVLKAARKNIDADHVPLLTMHINELRREFKAKRNFIKWLGEAFPC